MHPNGIPDSETFRRTFERIDDGQLAACLSAWFDVESGKSVAIDGKTIRGSAGAGKKALHVVSAWATEHGITLGQVAVNEKSNETTASPELLEVIDIRGSVVTIDAMGCQTAISEAIRNKGADYMLALKSNHKKLHEEVIKSFKAINAGNRDFVLDEHVEDSEGHGRFERHTVTVISASAVKGYEKWRDIKTIIRCTLRVIKDGHRTEYDRYFISSLPANARRIANISWQL